MTRSRLASLFSLSAICTACALYFSACTNSSTPIAQLPEATPESSSSALQSSKAGDVIPNQYIVVFASSGNQIASTSVDNLVQSTCNSINLPASAVQYTYRSAIRGFSATMTTEQAARLQKDSRIASIEPDRIIKLEPEIVQSDKTGNRVQSQTTPWGITKVGGAGNGTFSVTGHRAWIIDTGIDLTHSDLTVDVSRSKTFITSGQDAQSANDLNGHGTHVAGIIAAKNNTSGVVGVAAGATVVAIKVLNAQGSGTTSGVIAGVDWVRTHAAVGDVANMSLGGSISTSLDNAVVNAANAGIKFAVAAGNSATSANNSSPARANAANLYTVSAIDVNNVFAYFSNYGNPPVDYAAPGVNIYSLYKNGGTTTMSGTSMASPHVAGILLLGAIHSAGTAVSDPDGKPDPIAHR